MGLRNHSILIVEREWTQFARDLQAAIGHKGAITRVADGPADALLDAREFEFSGAVINADHIVLVKELAIPVLVYGFHPPSILVPFVLAPVPPTVLAAYLERLLSYRAPIRA